MSTNPWKDAWEELDDLSGPLGIYGTMDDLAKKHGIPVITTEFGASISRGDHLEKEVLRLQSLVTFTAILIRDADPQNQLANTVQAAVHSQEAWTAVADQATQTVAGYFPGKGGQDG